MTKVLFSLAFLSIVVTGTAQLMVPDDQIRFSESRGFDYDPGQDAIFYNGYNNGRVVKLGDPQGNGWFLGNLGIGTTAPTSILHLKSNSPTLQVQSTTANGASSFNLINDSGFAGLSMASYGSTYPGGSTIFRPNGVSLHTTSNAGASAGIAIAARHTSGYITFHSGGDTERMRILANGNIGIGTSSPVAKLEVVGPGTGSGPAIRASGGGDMLLNDGGALFFDGNYSYSTGNYIRPVSSNTQSFVTSGVERLRITPQGNIGVGTIVPANMFHVSSSTQTDRIAIQGTLTNSNVGFMIMNQNGTERWSMASIYDTDYLQFYRAGYGNVMILRDNGNVGIGTKTPNEKLTVNGTIYGKEIKVDLSVPSPDYVFEKDYNLPSLAEIQSFIDEHKHLPEVPSAADMKENGIEVGTMNMLLLKKIEELTLYVIQLQNQVEKQAAEIQKLQNK